MAAKSLVMIYKDFENILVPEDNGEQNPKDFHTNKYKNMLLVVMTINQYVYVIDFIDSIDEESKNCSDLMKEHCNLIRDVTFVGF